MEERKFWIVVGIVLFAGLLFNIRWFFWPFDFATSLVPGWHTTIYSPKPIFRSIFLLICIVAAIVIYLARKNKSKP